MPEAPNLLIQLQRMGDLVLSFPLMAWLKAAEPERPLWVLAEPVFFKPLMPLSPSVVFFPPEAEEQLAHTPLHRVVNLSHRPEAARIAGRMKAEQKLGACCEGSATRIRGDWQLYRASLVHNNRHNLFHWADLNALDLVSPAAMRRTTWPVPRIPCLTRGGRTGLFVGASEAAKRPDPAFWGELARELLRRGHKPVFLGGEAERPLGAATALAAGLPHSNLCGHFRLDELLRFLRKIDLLITPDTGPMHVGAWGGTLTLNLSMGPVNAWETAPFPPGHFVLRSTASCVGCWRCTRNPESPPCRELFRPARIAFLAHCLLSGRHEQFPRLSGLELLRTRRAASSGLFELEKLSGRSGEDFPRNARAALDHFWHEWFLDRLGGRAPSFGHAARRLAEEYPRALLLLRDRLPRIQAECALALRRGSLLPEAFWRGTPPMLRPLTGYLQLVLENGDYHRDAWKTALEHLEHLAALLAEMRSRSL